MLLEALVGQNAVPVVATVAEGIALKTFHRIIERIIALSQYRWIDRTVRASGPHSSYRRSFIAVMTVGAVNDA
jgi:hypothetical protein